MSKDFNSNGVNSSVTTENIEVRDMLHLCKNQLHGLAQRRNMQPPLYSCVRDGPPHSLRFKGKVSVGGQTFESPDFFRTLREAEHAAAKAALMELSAGVQEGEHSFYKTMLQELAAKQGFSLQYKTITAGASHMPTFFSTVEVDGEVFSGKAAKTKKQAEMNAAKVAFSKLYERGRSPLITKRKRKKRRKIKRSPLVHEVFSAPCFSFTMLIYCLITVICHIDMMRCLLFSGKSTWMQQSVEDTSFLEACVIVDLPPKLSSQATYTPAPSFSIQAPIESKDNHHENAGINTSMLSSSTCRALDAHQSSVTSDSLLNVGNISNSVQMMKTGSKDDSDVSTGEAKVSESFQSLNKDKAGIHKLITSATGKSSTDAVSQNVELFSSSNAMPSNKSDLTYASLRDPFPDGHSNDGISLPSKSSEHLDASDPPNSLPRGESGPTFLGDKILVYPHSTNITLPKGAIVLPISDDEWIAAKLEFPC
eukprot:TRINITY_DN6065_c0_g1_i15.p1 TRINITY_DN6065_c0_g1~~TRINITY_DN6065_c0_g1_i15.p1  ORF type:complete len:479 (+),score=95.95 TRINITY_DN6065_c0_g1_i15:524-1960(+)